MNLNDTLAAIPSSISEVSGFIIAISGGHTTLTLVYMGFMTYITWKKFKTIEELEKKTQQQFKAVRKDLLWLKKHLQK